jgi:excisionase family DNA binding protein
MSAMTLDPDEAHLQEGAAALVRRLRLLKGGEDGAPPRLVTSDGEELDVPPALFELLVAVAEELERGNGVSVLPLHRQLTTTEAAQLLNVSRPHVITLLERGELPFEKVGTHRRVRLADVLAYRHVQDRRRREALDDMVRQGEDLGLEY